MRQLRAGPIIPTAAAKYPSIFVSSSRASVKFFCLKFFEETEPSVVHMLHISNFRLLALRFALSRDAEVIPPQKTRRFVKRVAGWIDSELRRMRRAMRRVTTTTRNVSTKCSQYKRRCFC